MLSDEMTTGSVTSSESHKRAFAARSHSWNLTQPRIKDAFPEVSILSTFVIVSLSVGCCCLRSYKMDKLTRSRY